MSVPGYAEYKESGVAWLGDVPAHWSVSKVKTVIKAIDSGVSVNAVDTPAADGSIGVLKTSCVYDGTFRFEENKAVLEEELSRVACAVEKDALIVSRMNTPALVGAAGLVKESRPNIYLPDRLWQVHFQNCAPRFVHYWTLSPIYRYQVEIACAGTSSSMQNLGQDQFKNFGIPLPVVEEQSAIAAFLDRETGKIDALIAEQEKLLTLLAEKRQATISHAVTRGLNPNARMTDSGVPWLGKVPAHWTMDRLGALYGETAELGNDDLPILSVSIHDGVSDKELDDSELDRKVTRSDDRSKYKRVLPNDLTYNMMRAWQGGFGSVAVAGQVSPAYVVATPRRELRTVFIEQLLRTPRAIEQVRRYSRGITEFRLRLYWDEFKNIRVALPPLAEQDEILAAIASMTDKFDGLSAEARHAIDLLKERRRALISAAVTGKIDVRPAA